MPQLGGIIVRLRSGVYVQGGLTPTMVGKTNSPPMGDCTTQTRQLAPAKMADKATCQNGRKRAISAKMAGYSKSCAK